MQHRIDLDSSGDDEPDSDGTPELMDVLVDTLLSLLPHSSAPMRSAIEQVSSRNPRLAVIT